MFRSQGKDGDDCKTVAMGVLTALGQNTRRMIPQSGRANHPGTFFDRPPERRQGAKAGGNRGGCVPPPGTGVVPGCPGGGAIGIRTGRPRSRRRRSDRSAQFRPDDRSPGAQRFQLATRHGAGERHHAAVGAGMEPLCRHPLQRRAESGRDVLGRLDPVGGDVDQPTSTSLPESRPISSIGTCEFAHSSDTCPIADFASSGKVFSYCRHSLPSVFFQSLFALMP